MKRFKCPVCAAEMRREGVGYRFHTCDLCGTVIVLPGDGVYEVWCNTRAGSFWAEGQSDDEGLDAELAELAADDEGLDAELAELAADDE